MHQETPLVGVTAAVHKIREHKCRRALRRQNHRGDEDHNEEDNVADSSNQLYGGQQTDAPYIRCKHHAKHGPHQQRAVPALWGLGIIVQDHQALNLGCCEIDHAGCCSLLGENGDPALHPRDLCSGSWRRKNVCPMVLSAGDRTDGGHLHQGGGESRCSRH